MSVNIYDTANQLESELRQTDQYLKLKETFEKIHKDEKASELFTNFRQIQQTLQQKQMTGQEISEEEAQQAQEISGEISENETIAGLLEAEKAVGQMIDDINQVVLKPIQELYQ